MRRKEDRLIVGGGILKMDYMLTRGEVLVTSPIKGGYI